MPKPDGSVIDRNTDFDIAAVQVGAGQGMSSGALYLYRTADDPKVRMGTIHTTGYRGTRLRHFDENDPEVVEVQRRLIAGEASLYFEFGHWPFGEHLVPWSEVLHTHWYLTTVFPFHESGGNPHHFFSHLVRGCDFDPATDTHPARFKFPGIVEGTPEPAGMRFWFYQRAATKPAAPSIPYEGDADAMVTAFATAGWSRAIPGGFQPLWQFSQEVGLYDDGLPWWEPSTVQTTLVLSSLATKLRQMITAFRAWEAAPTTPDISYFTAITWWKAWFGYAHELLQGSRSSINVWSATFPRTQRTISGRQAVLDWVFNALLEWAGRGFATFRTTVDSDVLTPVLAEPSLTHVQADGSVGETLVGAIENSIWVRYAGPSYRAAGGIVSQVTANAGADKTVDSAGMVTLDGTETIVDGYGTTTRLWELIDGTGGSLSSTSVLAPTLTAPTLIPETADVVLTYRLTVTNDGVSDTDEAQVTVRAPRTTVTASAGSNKTVAIGSTVVLDGSATVVNAHGDTTYQWDLVSGAGTLDDPAIAAPTMTAGGEVGEVVWRLTATNNGISDTALVTVTVTA